MKKAKEVMDDFMFNLESNKFDIKRVRYPDDLEDDLDNDYIEKRVKEYRDLLDSPIIEKSLNKPKTFKLEYLPKHKRNVNNI